MDSLSSESEELEYGPGIVAKLKSKFLKYSMKVDHTYRNGHSIPSSCAASRVQSRRNALNRHNKLKRCSSVENILDDEQQQQQQQESDTANSPINGENLIKPRPPLQSNNHHSTAPVIKNYFFKSDASTTSPNQGTRTISTSKKHNLPVVASQTTPSVTHTAIPPTTTTTTTTVKTMAAGVATATTTTPTPAINGNECPGGNVKADSSTVNDDESPTSSVVKKAKSMDSLEWQHNPSCNSSNNCDFKIARDTNNQASDSDAPQVPERTSICTGYNRDTSASAKTAVVSPVLKLSPPVSNNNNNNNNNSSSSSSGSTDANSPSSPNSSNLPNLANASNTTNNTSLPIAPGRRRSLTRGSTLPPVKPVIAQKPRQHQDAVQGPLPVGPKPNIPPMNQRPVPPPRAQKALVASVSPLPATKTGTHIDTNNTTNFPQPTVTPPKPPVSPSASTAPLIATKTNNSNSYSSISKNNNTNTTTTTTATTTNNNINKGENSNNNCDDGRSLNSLSSTKSITPTNATMATCSLLNKNNALNKSDNVLNESTNGITTSRSTQHNNSNVNVSNKNDNNLRESTQTQKQSILPSSLSNGIEGVESKASFGKSSIINSSNSVVFDFRGKNVQPALAVASPYGRNAAVDAADPDEDYRGCMEIPPPCNIYFQGENQIVGRGALLKTRDKRLNISFDDTATTTFEYPSEQSLLQVDDSEAKWDPLRSGMSNTMSHIEHLQQH